MSNNFRALNRQILTQFLSNHEAIKAFEQALTDVGTTFPDAIAALEAESSENSQQAGSAFAGFECFWQTHSRRRVTLCDGSRG